MFELDESQKAAVHGISLLASRIYLLTGAGGSGKTFTLFNLLERLWDDPTNNITKENTYLAAPTGKAAKVVDDSLPQGFLDHPPATIHRILGYNPAIGWMACKDNPLDAGLMVIDEGSMVDSELLFRVIDALPSTCHLLMLGDVNQLPPVGPGAPFTDLITHGDQSKVFRLTTNHRQTQGSLIATACLSVLDGKTPLFGDHGAHTLGGELKDDLFLIEKDDKEEVPETVVEICRGWHDAGLDYAVLAPQRTGVCGVDAMNKYLQEQLNPSAPDKQEIKVAWLTLRVGDKVLATKNNYDLDVFNGYTGKVIDIDQFAETITVDYDGQIVRYEDSEDIKQLSLGYCMTIHKSQGSTIDYGVIICHSSHYYMLSRGLLYTAVSRFRKELYVVGDKRAIKRGVTNVIAGDRNTFIKLQLQSER